jgi:hypothetical protein
VAKKRKRREYDRGYAEARSRGLLFALFALALGLGVGYLCGRRLRESVTESTTVAETPGETVMERTTSAQTPPG